MVFYKCQENSTWTFANATASRDQIRKEIEDNGPIHVSMTVYEDFYLYSSGIYEHKEGKAKGGHAIKCLGFGTEVATQRGYWICVNSWGTGWGEDGFFKVYDDDLTFGYSGGACREDTTTLATE